MRLRRELTKMQGTKLSYRPDIDGLRAIAVLLVLLFHFNLGVPGGFIGVDVFFVISGFLITDVIRTSCKSGKYSFYNFYARRLTRLHPALIATVVLALATGYLIMDPGSLAGLASAAKYSVLSLSNILFWKTQGYFDASSAMQPLLHTWSLSVEWQFYMVWPLIVWASLKASDRLLAGVLVVIGVTSLIASQWMLGIDSSAAYFLMPFRGFELAIGALLVFTKDIRLQGWQESAAAVLGLAMIVTSAFALDSNSPFPGVAALAPCIGAALCIQFGKSSAGALLRSSAMVRIGLISYSVYLVHWPILVFAKYYLYRDLTTAESVGLMALSLVVGHVIYSIIERPFIDKGRAGRPIPLAGVVAGVTVIGAFTLSLANSQGAPSRIPEKHKAFAESPAEFHVKNYGGAGFADDTDLGAPANETQFLLAGDSFALQYASGIDSILKDSNLKAQGQFTLGCFLARTHTRFENGTSKMECQRRYNTIIASLRGNSKPLVISMNWSGYFPYIADLNGNNVQFSTTKEYEEFIYKSLDELLQDAGARKVFIVGVAPFLATPVSAASCLLRPGFIHQPCEDRLKYQAEQAFAYGTNKALRGYADSRDDVYFIDPSDTLCKEGGCAAISNGKILYSDGVHLSKEGGKIVSESILKSLESHM